MSVLSGWAAAPLIASLVLAGCLGDRLSSSSGVRVGDVAEYEMIGTGSITRITVTSLESNEVVSHRECPTVRLVEEIFSTSRSNPDRAYSHAFCLDGSFSGAQVEREGYVNWDGTRYERFTFLPPLSFFSGGYLMCALICATLPEEGFHFDTWLRPSERLEVELRAAHETGVFELANRATTFDDRGNSTHENVLTLDLRDGAYPDSFQVHQTSIIEREGETRSQLLEWRRVSLSPGEGPAVRLSSGSSTGALRIASPEAWAVVPPEHDSPFRFSQATAMELLALHPVGGQYFQSNPQAFLAAAHYGEYWDEPNGQEELLWVFLWKQGAQALLASCHRITTSVLVAGLPVEECFEVNTFQSRVPQERSGQPEKIVSWDAAARALEEATGRREPIRTAFWTTLAEWVGPLGPSEHVELAPSPWILVSPSRGQMTSDPAMPAWSAKDPADWVRLDGGAGTIFDAATGQLLVLHRPVEG